MRGQPTGNAELKLDRRISERRVFPAVDVNPSGTRKDELLLAPEEARCACYAGQQAQVRATGHVTSFQAEAGASIRGRNYSMLRVVEPRPVKK